jgi:hypothetical protein
MQCAPISAREFVLRQAFAGFASGKILMRFAGECIGDEEHDDTSCDVIRTQIVRMFSCVEL